MEKTFYPVIEKYVTSGYLEERKKTSSNILKLNKAASLFMNANPEQKAEYLQFYINSAKELESLTGKRILP